MGDWLELSSVQLVGSGPLGNVVPGRYIGWVPSELSIHALNIAYKRYSASRAVVGSRGARIANRVVAG